MVMRGVGGGKLAMLDVLTETELMTAADLEAAEAVIESGLRTFVDVGNALLSIRDGRGYRLQGHGTFEDYCRARWGFTRMRASQLIAAAEVVANVNHGLQPPANERQARALSELEPEQQREAWALAVETAPNGKVTAAHVERVVDQLTGEIIDRKPAANVIHVSDDSYEWFTPKEYTDAAREVMGAIDLDPASCAEANAVVGASEYFTRDDDGLAQVWAGRVWMNPPYNMPLIEHFVRRVTDEYEAGNVPAAVVLVNNSTDTGWFHVLLEASSAVCFTRGRLKFWNGDDRLAARQGQAIFYLGDDPNYFVELFAPFGAVLRKYDD